MAQAKFSSLMSKIETAEDAHKVVKETSLGFFVVAALQTAIGVVFMKNPWGLVDVTIMVVGALLLRTFNSRAAAVVLFLLALTQAGSTLANMLGVPFGGGGSNILLALVMMWIAYRAIQATFKLKSLSAAPG